MPPTKVEFDHGYKALDRVLHFWHWKEGFRVCHEAAMIVVSSPFRKISRANTL